jgi:hypothetical protein
MQVQVSMSAVNLESAPSYEAISYTWGSPNMSHRILINELPFYTTKSAFDVLRGRSSFWRTRVLWIDSICINQDDNDEKGKQIHLMREIYQNCSRVIVWLGNHGGILTSLLSTSFLYHLSSPSYGPLSIPLMGSRDGGPAANFNYIRLQCLSWFLNNPWFERVWIVQEVALPRVVHVVHNGQYLDWDVLAEAAKSFMGPQGFELTELLQCTRGGRRARRTLDKIRTISKIRQNSFLNNVLYRHLRRILELFYQIIETGVPDIFEGFPAESMEQVAETSEDPEFVQTSQKIFGESTRKLLTLHLLLKTFAFLKSTEDVDKVYALIGLITDDSGAQFTPTYPMSPQILFTEIARYLLSTQDPFCVLHCAGIGHKRKYEDLPSWAPDWTTTPRVYDLSPSNPRYSPNTYKSSGDSEAQVAVCLGREAMHVRAIYVDEIAALGTEHTPRDEEEEPIMNSKGHQFYAKDHRKNVKWHSEAWSLAQEKANPPLKTRRDLKEAF